MRSLFRPLTCTAAFALLVAPSPSSASCDTSGLAAGSEVVELTLTGGTLCLEMLRADAPENVDNFLYYVTNGEYDGSLFHRFVTGFVLQGGDQRRDGSGGFESIPKRAVVVHNEPCTADTPGPDDPTDLVCSERGNERGTVAFARLGPGAPGGGPDSASNNFFFNVADNREILDNANENQNEGFTVFARVMGDGITYVDTLVLPTDYQRQAISGQVGAFAQLALIGGGQGVGDYTGCFDPNANVAGVLNPAALPSLIGKADPRSGSFPFLLATTCGAVPVEDETTFVPSPCSGQITSQYELSVGVDPASLVPDSSPPTFFRHSCSAVDQFLAAIDAARLDPSYQAAYDAQVVIIETAALTIVPEPSPLLLQLAAGVALLSLRWLRICG